MAQTTLDIETSTLLRHLNAQRGHALSILEGLDEDALRRSMLPTGWSCLELVQHLALDVEKFWFRAVVAGEQTAIDELTVAPDAWQVDADMSIETVFAAYRQQIDRSDAIISATPLDMAPAWWPGDFFGNWRLNHVREVILYVITETACYAGQLDAVRQAGRVSHVLHA